MYTNQDLEIHFNNL